MVRFPVASRSGQNLRARGVRAQIVKELLQELCRQNKRFNPVTP